MKQSVPKRQHIKFRLWGITQKKENNIYSMEKVLKSRLTIYRVAQEMSYRVAQEMSYH